LIAFVVSVIISQIVSFLRRIILPVQSSEMVTETEILSGDLLFSLRVYLLGL